MGFTAERYLIGIDVGGTNIKMMVCGADYRVIGQGSIPTRRELGYERISDNILTALENIFEAAGIQQREAAAVAMGLPGVVDRRGQKSVYLSYLGWNGFNPCRKIAEHFHAPSVIDNDANLHALGEYYFGVGRAYSDLVLITLGTGVGCGIISDGKLFGGASNLAGELGHLTLTPDSGEICLCGKRGCMEAYCSGSAMSAHAKRLMAESPYTLLHRLVAENGGVFDNRLVDAGAAAGDEACLEIYRRFTYYLTIGIANLIKLFNPQRVLIGGGLSGAGDLLFVPVNRDVKQYLLHERQCCPVEKARLGSRAGMYGAAVCAGLSVGIEPPPPEP